MQTITPAIPTTGLFIALEGGEGTGKTTQIRILAERLRRHGLPVTETREPGGTVLGQQIRAMVLDPANTDLSRKAEALLYAADRAHHVDSVIRPALACGGVVITDRYMDSSLAYQGYGRGHDLTSIRDLSLWAAGGLVPTVTVVLDIDPRAGLARATRNEFGSSDRFEAEAIDFHQRVRSGFAALADQHPDRYVVVDAADRPESVADTIWDAVSSHAALLVSGRVAA